MNNQMTEEQLIELLNQLDTDLTVPFDAQVGWRNAVRREARRKKSMSGFVRYASWAAAVLLAVGLTFIMRGAGILGEKAQSSSADFKWYTAQNTESASVLLFESDSSFESEPLLTGEAAQAKEPSESEDETNGFVHLADAAVSASDLSEARKTVRTLTDENGGYVQTEKETENGAEMTVLVPQENYETLLSELEARFDSCKIDRYTRYTENLYTDATQRLASAQATAERLNTLIADASAEEISSLNAIRNSVYDDIDSISSEVSRYEDMKDTAIINFTVTQSGNRLKNAFTSFYGKLFSFAEDTLLTLAVLLPVIALTAAICLLLVKRKRK